MGVELKSRELDFQNDFRSTKLGYEIKVGDILTCYAHQFKSKNYEVYPINNEELQKEIDLIEEILIERFKFKRIDLSADLGSKFEIISIKVKK